MLNYPVPQAKLEKQLKSGVRYVTSIAFGGHCELVSYLICTGDTHHWLRTIANQFIATVKLVYLAKLTSRVAIM